MVDCSTARFQFPPPVEVDVTSFSRTEHLIKRLGGPPETAYAAYQRAEESLADMENPKRMSRLSERILASIDFESVRRIRKENFKLLHSRLGDDDSRLAEMDEMDIPLCYPYQSRDVGLRQRFISNRIFVASYWDDALDRLTPDRANKLVRNMFPLPIDQRYSEADMERISAIVLDKK